MMIARLLRGDRNRQILAPRQQVLILQRQLGKRVEQTVLDPRCRAQERNKPARRVRELIRDVKPKAPAH